MLKRRAPSRYPLQVFVRLGRCLLHACFFRIFSRLERRDPYNQEVLKQGSALFVNSGAGSFISQYMVRASSEPFNFVSLKFQQEPIF